LFLLGVLQKNGVQNVVFCVVNVVTIVVSVWWLVALNSASKNAPRLGDLFLV